MANYKGCVLPLGLSYLLVKPLYLALEIDWPSNMSKRTEENLNSGCLSGKKRPQGSAMNYQYNTSYM